MEDIIKIVGLGIIGMVLAIVLKQEKPELSILLSMVVGSIILMYVLVRMSIVVDFVRRFSGMAGVDQIYLKTILKVIAISYITQFGASICEDAGEGAMAKYIELAGRTSIIICGIPIFMAILESLMQLL